jgi:hypothetical protein
VRFLPAASALLLAALLAPAALAQAVVAVEGEALDTPARMVLNEPATPGGAWTGAFILTASAEAKLTFVSSPLDAQDGRFGILAQRVTVPEKTTLAPGSIERIVVSVPAAEVRAPGNYTGNLSVYLTAGNRSERVAVVPMWLNASLPASLRLVHETHLHMTRCSWLCFLADVFVQGESAKDRAVLVGNDGRAPARVVNASLEVPSGDGAQQSNVSATAPAILEARDDGSVVVHLKGGGADLLPGHYNATLVVRTQGASEPSRLPLSLDVRASPLWALLALVAGIVVAWLVRIARDAAQPEHAAIRHTLQLSRAARGLSGEDQAVLQKHLNSLTVAAGNGRVADFAIEAPRVRQSLLIARQLTVMEKRASPEDVDTHAMIAEAREKLGEGNPDAAAKKLASLGSPGFKGTQPKTPRTRLSRAWWAMRHDPQFQRLRDRALKGALGLGSALVLALLGLKALYAGNPTFGANVAWDYLALATWGFTGKLTAQSLREGFLPGVAP